MIDLVILRPRLSRASGPMQLASSETAAWAFSTPVCDI